MGALWELCGHLNAGSLRFTADGKLEEKRKGRWQPRIWLAPAFRHLGLFDEVEEAMFTLMSQMPDPSGPPAIRLPELQAA